MRDAAVFVLGTLSLMFAAMVTAALGGPLLVAFVVPASMTWGAICSSRNIVGGRTGGDDG